MSTKMMAGPCVRATTSSAQTVLPAPQRSCSVPPVPAIDAEPDDERLVKLDAMLSRLTRGVAAEDLVLIHEGPLKHHAGARAAQLAFWWQACIALWCRECGVCRVEVPPIDLQRFVLGRGATNGAGELLAAARSQLGYAGNDDNAADALWLLAWGRVHLVGAGAP